ncbi:acid phosphatase type 7 isoform X2 [Panulirus ornatus]|uniref:acid phosphatase type 7 isoform X2 n=1 Tax=Panulirus ornatus TaxID=150431 RepID=UPI003A835E81
MFCWACVFMQRVQDILIVFGEMKALGCILMVPAMLSQVLASLPFMFDIGEVRTDDFQPQQIHIAIGESAQDMVITWTTPSETSLSVVEFGRESLNDSAHGIALSFTDGGSEHRKMWIHRVTLKDLLPDTRYFYHCGSPLGWSEVFVFKTWKNGTDWPVSVAMYGDMGAVNAQSLSRLQKETQNGMYHAVIHVGDFAYDMDSDNARVGDEFMRQIQPIAAYVPYMTCPGNHEYAYNFSNYRARFSMPNYEDTESFFFSWNMGPVHFIAVNTEAYYFLEFGLKPLSRQYEWLINDLEEATKPEVRAEHPWIILFGHRPMYCSNNDHDDCTRVNCLTRVGLPLIHTYAMEELLDKYGVDLAVWAHEHSYERLWPMFNYTVMNGSTSEPYTNPKAPVHFTTGSAGCDEIHDHFMPEKPYWSAIRSIDYGYTRLKVYNTTHMYWEQVSDDQLGQLGGRHLLLNGLRFVTTVQFVLK